MARLAINYSCSSSTRYHLFASRFSQIGTAETEGERVWVLL
jgi:hypothetical protein